MYVAFCRVLVMSKEGCKVSFWKIHRFYKWNELKVKRYENYKGMRYGTPRGLKQGYEEGIFFSLKKDKKPNGCRLRRTVVGEGLGVHFLLTFIGWN